MERNKDSLYKAIVGMKHIPLVTRMNINQMVLKGRVYLICRRHPCVSNGLTEPQD